MTETAEIISGRNIPSILRKGAKPKYNWLAMKPGDAFRFADDVKIGSAYSMASARGKDFAMRFVVRQEPDGLWCYRVDGLANEPPHGNVMQDLVIVKDREMGPAEEEGVVGYGI